MMWIIECRKLSVTTLERIGEMGFCNMRQTVVGIRDCANCQNGGHTKLVSGHHEDAG